MTNIALEAYKKNKDDDAVVPIKEATKRDGEFTEAYPLGYKILDDAMDGGVRDGDLIVGTGISGHGKTTAFLNFSSNLSAQGFPCLFFSYEVVIDNLYAKFKSMGVADTDNFHLYTPKHNTSGNLKWVQEKIEEGLEKYNAKFIFIDDIEALSSDNSSSSDQFRMKLRNICVGLKSMAISLEIVIFVAVHLKKVEGRRVQMQDLSESAATFQKPDYVLDVHRESYIDVNGREVFSNEGVINFLKNRFNGKKPYMEFILENNIIIPAISAQDVNLSNGGK